MTIELINDLQRTLSRWNKNFIVADTVVYLTIRNKYGIVICTGSPRGYAGIRLFGSSYLETVLESELIIVCNPLSDTAEYSMYNRHEWALYE